MRRELKEWRSIVRDIERTGEYYDKVNELISLGYGDKLRSKVSDEVKNQHIVLDAGCGPGTLSRKILEYNDNVYVIGLDASYNLIKRASILFREFGDRYDLVVGVFENPPFREEVFDGVYTAYAIRDAIRIDKAISNLYKLLKSGGILMDIDIGKPDNIILRILLKIYMYTIVPLIALIIYRRLSHPWWGLGKTLDKLPKNSVMKRIFKEKFSRVVYQPYALSTLYIIKGYK